MSDKKGYLLRKISGDIPLETEQEIHDLFQRGQCRPADFLHDFAAGKWLRVGDHPSLASLLGPKPSVIPEKRLIYFLSTGSGGPSVMGPFSTKEIQQKMNALEICESSWVFVEGDKDWRLVKNIKVLLDLLPALPVEVPAPPAASPPPPAFALGPEGEQSNPSIRIDLEGATPTGGSPGMEQEDPTMALSTLGLSLKVDHTQPQEEAPPPPPKPKPPGILPSTSGDLGSPGLVRAGSPKDDPDQGSFDGITAEIPPDPIWLIKKANSEAVSGPFPFLEISKFLQEGRITKNDKISKVGSNRFVKIQQQYEFNVKYSVETVVENGLEKQKILIKRRHPRVPYFTEVQILTKNGILAGSCVNVSAGGILIEMGKAEFNLGDILETKILPGLIPKSISCRCLVIGKIPKMPPGYALKFEDLKNEDKEAIEFYVQETLRREMSKNI